VQVTLRGSGFVNGVASRATEATRVTALKFGSNAVQSFQVIDDETIDARVPPGSVGPAAITIENANGRFVCAGCFTYYEEVFLRAATPREGPLRGGTTVTLTGAGFTPDVHVLFGGQSAPAFSVGSSSSMTVTAPRAVAAGTVDVTVYSKNGLGALRRAYRYYDDLRVSAVAPLSGPLAGATTVVITGSGFDGATSVTFGGVPAASFTVNSSTQITALTPSRSSPGAVPLEVITPRDRWVARGAFSYVNGTGFAVYGVFPHVGPAAGGNVVTVTGEGLDAPNLAITFGGQSAAITNQTANEATVSVPMRGLSRKVDVVSTAAGPSSSLPQAYTYGIALTDIAPRSGPIAGGTAATLAGSAFPPDAEVFIGAGQAPVQGAPSESSIAVLTPAGQGGVATDVWVREAADPENEATLEDVFTFDEPISVGRVQPARGAIAGGTLITVLGSGFGESTLVRFGANVAKDIKLIDSHTLTCRTPRGSVGVVDVKVSRLGSEDSLPGAFAYFDPRSISGGLSGGPLTGTLNVTVLDSTPGLEGMPVQLATVMLGIDPFTPFQGSTDTRGQITFSDPSLVKPPTVTVFKEGYESATVTSVSAENLTVFIARTSGEGDPAPGQPPPAASVISGKVTGFKAPRPLGASEVLEARVFLAQRSLFSGAPFRDEPPEHLGETWQVRTDGGAYRLFSGAGLRATYAILGVWNTQTRVFEPYLMGVRRGITVTADQPASEENIVLDMHLDQSIPVAIDSPVYVDGAAAPNELYGWVDLGAEGFIPNPNNWSVIPGLGPVGPGSGTSSSILSTSESLTFPSFPQLDGSNFIFMNRSARGDSADHSVCFRRQPGDLSQSGVTIGPMLPIATFVEPAGAFDGVIRWTVDPGAMPDIHNVLVMRRMSLMGQTFDIPVWSIVLPGSETQVTLPATAVEKLRQEEAGNTLFVELISSRSPKFSYSQWTYDVLSGVTWSSYMFAASASFTP
jgi:hypothetical protein